MSWRSQGPRRLKALCRRLYPNDDYEWIVKGGAFQVLTTAGFRPANPRIDLANPEKSLLLLKPTGSVPHGAENDSRWILPSTKRSSVDSKNGAPFGPEVGKQQSGEPRVISQERDTRTRRHAPVCW